ncbi:MAG: PEP-CTERM sorting domain-containing protein [Phycisphaerae bacterium]|nr:PEP-CTERM sorting domain-containing protein [Phycisphaerae bacterium]
MLRSAGRMGLVVCVVAGACCPLLGASPSFAGLGLNGGDRSFAYDISGDGAVAVGAYGGNGLPALPFSWNSGLMTTLPTLCDPCDANELNEAYAVSYDGSVVVGVSATMTAVRWADGVVSPLEGTGYSHVGVHGVSGNGNTIVGYGWKQTNQEAVRWDNGVPTSMGLGPVGSAIATSGDGSVIVGTNPSGVLWEDGTETTLGGLTPKSISADGGVVVGMVCVDEPMNTGSRAARWSGGVLTELGILPGGDPNSIALDASADGSVIVGCTVECFHAWYYTGIEAFIWTEPTGMVNLQDLFASEYDLDLTGWTLQEAVAVSDDGLTVVGNGVNPDGYSEAWIAHIPEPGSLALLGCGIAATLVRRHRRRR